MALGYSQGKGEDETLEQWQVVEGTGWIAIPGFGEINPRRDNEAGGRQYFSVTVSNGEYAKVAGPSITQGPETWNFEFDEEFWLADRDGHCLEIQISPLVGGRYAVKYRDGEWPNPVAGGWT